MLRIKARDVTGFLIAATLSGILYRAWLTTPVLEYVTLDQWRAVAVLVALLVGAIWSLFRQNVSTLVVGFISGALVAGTGLEWGLQDVVPRSVGSAFQSHIEAFGSDLMMLTVAMLLSGYCSARLIGARRNSEAVPGSTPPDLLPLNDRVRSRGHFEASSAVGCRGAIERLRLNSLRRIEAVDRFEVVSGQDL